MASLFPDDLPKARAAGTGTAFRRFPKRPKALETEIPPLPDGGILAHCDGGSRGNPGPAGFGVAISDAEGEDLAELSEFLGFRTNNYAEYSGLLAVLDWALEHRHTRLRLISDSELMVKQIQGKYKVNSPDLKPLHEEAKRRIARLDGFEIHHALRHKNKDADRLANEAMDRGMAKGRAVGSNAQEPRATPYPAAAPKPPAPASFGGREEQCGLGAAAGNRASSSTTAVPAPASAPPSPTPSPIPSMLRGFVRDGVVHPLGSARLPEGSFVKIIPE